MHVLRSLAFLAALAIVVVPYAIFLTFFIVAPVRVRYRVAVGWLHFAIWAARAICGIRYELRGGEILERLKHERRGVILAPKHQSAWETLALPAIAPAEVCYVYKRELHWIPFFGWGLAQLRMIHIDRSRGTEAFEQVVEQGSQRLAEGRWVIMFPEGTRTPVGARTRYKTGAARFASRTGALVVPIALNSGECWPRNAFVKRPGTITVSVGPPIATEGRTPDAINADIERWIETEMRRISPHAYDEPSPADTSISASSSKAV
ncbi:MAG TPA: lysophospholipid acyltransferase family protein [Burkholderiaceae bacterium]|nr:lysophospholipid acyltransferase family protein [Burkholderiaceae bacterium]